MTSFFLSKASQSSQHLQGPEEGNRVPPVNRTRKEEAYLDFPEFQASDSSVPV